MSTPKVILKPKRAQPFFGRHPWVFAGAIARVEGEPGRRRRGRSRLARRPLRRPRPVQQPEQDPRPPLLLGRRRAARPRVLPRAARTRRSPAPRRPGAERPDAGCRVVFSEADGLSGMIVDRYDDWLVVQFTALGLAQRRDDDRRAALRSCSQPTGIYLRTENGIGKLEGLELHDGRCWGEPPPAGSEHRRERPALPREPGGGAEDRLLPRPARQPAAVAAARAPAGACSMPSATPAASGCTRRRPGPRRCSASMRPSRPWTWPRATPTPTAWRTSPSSAPTSSTTSRTGREPAAVRRDRARPAEVRPQPRRRPGGAQGLSPTATAGAEAAATDGVLVSCCCTGLIGLEELEDVIGQVAVEVQRETCKSWIAAARPPTTPSRSRAAKRGT